MGIKENFTQAVRELTGIGKDKNAQTKGATPVDELKKAVEDDFAGSLNSREITLDSAPRTPMQPISADAGGLDDLDSQFSLDSMNSSVRPMPSQGRAPSPAPESTPIADAFMSQQRPEVPVSLFGRNMSDEQPPQSAREAARPVSAPPLQFNQNPFAQTPASTQFNQNPFAQNPGYAGYSGRQTYQQNPPVMSPIPVPASRTAPGGEDNELTIISRNTVVDGNIRSFADMSIDGDIKGDVETTKNIDLNGKIVGNVTCNNAMMHTSQIQGDVRMRGNVSMKRDTLLIGDLMSTYAEVNGKVKGNLDVVGKADLKGDAVVFGDISASTITVEDGAIIQGYVSTTFLNKEESKNLFPDTVVIGDVAGATRL